MTEYPIHVDQLCVGLFIRLEVGDKKSPFLRKSFKIKNEKQIKKIREMGVTHVHCMLAKSDCLPIPPEEVAARKGGGPAPAAKAAEKPKPKTPVSAEILGLKQETIERNKERRAAFSRCEKKYDQAVGQVVTILRRASGRAAEAAEDAGKVVGALVGTFLSDRDVVLNLMSSKPSEEQKNYHAMNVTVLAMMLGKEAKLNEQAMQVLGMGALFHDIGKGRVNMQELKGGKATIMQKAVDANYKLHSTRGAQMAGEMPAFPRPAVNIIKQHHESVDGRGFPDGLKGKDISPLARIVAIVDAYDKLLNEPDGDSRRTPHEVLKQLYAGWRGRLDEKLLGVFIRNMGVFPPGCVVELSNKMIGMVVSSNPKAATRPSVLVYHPEIPKKEALIVDLSVETEIEVARSLRPESLDREVFQYLSPSRSINYYADNA